MTPYLLSKQEFDFHRSDTNDEALPGNFRGVQIVDLDVGASDCRSLHVKKEYSQIDLVNHVFRLLSSAGLLAAHCSKTAKYIVKGHGGIIGSEYVSYYTVVAC